MEVPTKNKVIESIDSPGAIDKFAGVSRAKSFKTWISGRKSIATKRNNLEMLKLLETIEKAYNYYHPNKIVEVPIDSWKGKSSFEIMLSLDGISIVKYQRPDKHSQPKPIVTDVTKEELNCILESLNGLCYLNDMSTRDLAEKYCKKMYNIDEHYFKKSVWTNREFDWDKFYAYRSLHNKLTLILGALDQLKLIEYSGGKSRVLKKPLSLQMILP